jgi:predicted nucleotidyltransferase
MKAAEGEIAQTLDFLADNPDLLLVVIFGSIANDSQRPDSDIDVAFFPKKRFSGRQRQQLVDQIACATGRTVDLVDLSDIDGALLRQILHSGRVIFSKQPGITGILTERLLGWQEDFEPQLNALLESRLQRFIHPAYGT